MPAFIKRERERGYQSLSLCELSINYLQSTVLELYGIALFIPRESAASDVVSRWYKLGVVNDLPISLVAGVIIAADDDGMMEVFIWLPQGSSS